METGGETHKENPGDKLNWRRPRAAEIQVPEDQVFASDPVVLNICGHC